jgi:hypothetical protein
MMERELRGWSRRIDTDRDRRPGGGGGLYSSSCSWRRCEGDGSECVCVFACRRTKQFDRSKETKQVASSDRWRRRLAPHQLLAAASPVATRHHHKFGCVASPIPVVSCPLRLFLYLFLFVSLSGCSVVVYGMDEYVIYPFKSRHTQVKLTI